MTYGSLKTETGILPIGKKNGMKGNMSAPNLLYQATLVIVIGGGEHGLP